jgi:hypothetical protein
MHLHQRFHNLVYLKQLSRGIKRSLHLTAYERQWGCYFPDNGRWDCFIAERGNYSWFFITTVVVGYAKLLPLFSTISMIL